ncbi:serine/threonine-protein kinase [Gracilimonas sediminicola]|uniref:Serine/threonine-protein kinase n=1 Tax=Gracilimonas sediminicola TaxID=2952158 RepID=A0A9X2L1C1_9BACT|nr:serine/threonine-protein kinase [Gracilimonas sediminicola]MCP9290394.1 serine/threonine-protein kinase [Gracilimonas sediminicola]
MDKYNWQTVENIIDEVLELPIEKRKEYIRERCRGNESLKKEVTLLLSSITESEGWLEHPEEYKSELFKELTSDISDLSVGRSLEGTRIGAYTIIEEIGFGGMGHVYRAERDEDDISHQVAIKILNRRRTEASVIERFRREQQVLAKLNHPHIAQFFDGGVTADGSPYIIMEFVDGIPIDEYCIQNNCTFSQQIDLFKDVLKGVRYAHENLVIHRDLKPENILVTTDGDVKILDFGISKMLGDDVDDTLTKEGPRLLTPKYAAPEQILQSNITTATDTYALGILLYYLLTHTFPFNLDNLTRYEAEQAILKNNPAKPSDAAGKTFLKKQLTGDLDAIILKAIRKESDYRYRTVNHFLEDLENYEANLPVSAHRNTKTYRVKKFLKRNKKNVGIGSAFLMVIVTMVGVFTWQLSEERNQATLEAEKAESVKDLLIDIFEANDPISNSDDNTPSLSVLLEAGTNKILAQNIDPSVKTELLLTLATIYQNITQFDKALELTNKSLEISNKHFGSQSIQTAQGYIKLGGIQLDLGKYQMGKTELNKAKNILNNRLQASDKIYAKLYSHLGAAEENLGNYETSQNYFKEALSVTQRQSKIDSAMLVNELRSVARGYHRGDQHEKGDSLMLKALDVSEAFHGESDIVTASVLGDLGLYLMTRAEYKQARNYFERSLEIKEQVYGEKGHPKYTATLTNLAVLEKTLSNFETADSLFVKTMRIDEKIFGPDHPYVAMSKSHLGGINHSLGNYNQARKYYTEAIEVYTDSYGPEHPYMGGVYKGYARAASALGEYNVADDYFDRSLRIYKNDNTADSALYAKLYEAMGIHYKRSGRHREALEYFQQCADLFYPLYYDEYKIRSVKCHINMADSHLSLSHHEKAKATLNHIHSRIDSLEVLSNHEGIQKLLTQTENQL